MLTALEQGVKGGVWFSLIDKVWTEQNLRSSYVKVAANKGSPGVDHVTIEDFGLHLVDNMSKLTMALRRGSYCPQAIRRTYIPKPGSTEVRPLGIPTVRDRVVQGAVRHVLEPIFEKEFSNRSYGFRPGIGCKDALRRLDNLMKTGYVYVVDVDLKSYFDSIPHGRLLDRLNERIADTRILGLIESFLKAGIMEGLREWEPETGAPQGAVLSPLLSNVYLNPLDHMMSSKGYEMLRYADDFVIVCRSQSEAEQALAEVRQWCAAEGLTVHPTKTRIVDVRVGGFDFLGYHFTTLHKGPNTGRIVHWPRKTSLAKFKDNVREKTERTISGRFEDLIRTLNHTLRGWFGYFKHSFYKIFRWLDGWVRRRLRSLLRARLGIPGVARPPDNRRWPIAFFAKHRLYSLEKAHAQASQPPCG